jgi:hypothetical protein
VLLAIATILVATGVEPFNLVLVGQAAESGPLVVFIVSLLSGGFDIFLSSQTSRRLAGSADFLSFVLGAVTFALLVSNLFAALSSTK